MSDTEQLDNSDNTPEQNDETTAWSQLVLTELMSSLFDGKGHFDVCVVDELDRALNHVRDALGMQRHKSNGITKAALNALHCQDFDKMDVAVRAGIKQAVWRASGLTEDIGQAAFGAHWERVKTLDVKAIEEERPFKSLSRDPRLLLSVVWLVLMVFGLVVASAFSYSIGKDRGRIQATTQTWMYKSDPTSDPMLALPQLHNPSGIVEPRQELQAKPDK